MKMNVINAIATVSVSDCASSTQWYTALFGRQPDSKPMPSVTEWKFPGGGWLQVAEDGNRAGRSSVTLPTGEIAEVVTRLEELNIAVDQTLSSEIVKIAMCEDPDGNRLVFTEPETDEIAQ
ncbi:VOC family protein [Granulosicoccus sp. 3-233]|uniref:VOC family protein n=1 Tax=Granulosicoccus sp. 3-233 TaxID=3417969 RepID=UPI003D34319D